MSLPSRERGLKYALTELATRRTRSLPSRERGLKLQVRRSFLCCCLVAPLAGARIEI